jgi:hypothetical protein
MPPPSSPKPKRPIEPRPEDFGLTPERVRKLEDPFGAKVTGSLFLVSLVLLGYIFGIMGVLASLGWWLLMIYAFGGVSDLISKLWSKTQPDSASFEHYRRAVAKHGEAKRQFEREWAEWLRSQENWWRGLDGGHFEAEIARLLERSGFSVQHMGGPRDGGVDLIIHFLDQKEIFVQCKAHKSPVGPGPVRDLYGTLVSRRGNSAWLISTSGFTPGATAFAQGKPIRLVTLNELLPKD